MITVLHKFTDRILICVVTFKCMSLWLFIEPEKTLLEPTSTNEKDEETVDKDSTQRILSAVHTETKGEVTIDSKTGKNNTKIYINLDRVTIRNEKLIRHDL